MKKILVIFMLALVLMVSCKEEPPAKSDEEIMAEAREALQQILADITRIKNNIVESIPVYRIEDSDGCVYRTRAFSESMTWLVDDAGAVLDIELGWVPIHGKWTWELETE